uniref:Uncharacterized protein n=1 Tax=Fagus sylvatica TaxID=28930 RepID=A0A2N9GDH7_FAGSY
MPTPTIWSFDHLIQLFRPEILLLLWFCDLGCTCNHTLRWNDTILYLQFHTLLSSRAILAYTLVEGVGLKLPDGLNFSLHAVPPPGGCRMPLWSAAARLVPLGC